MFRLGLLLVRCGVMCALILAPAACGVTEPETIATTGTIGFWDGEGGCWTINTPVETLSPAHLAEEFKVEGLAVRFEGERRTDLVSPCPGDVISFRSIRKISE